VAYEVRRSLACRRDLEVVFDHLAAAYEELGDSVEDAFGRAEARLAQIEDELDGLGAAPHQGTLWPEVMDGLRWTTKNRAIFYFTVDDATRIVNVLAVFFGGQDHKAHILRRILGEHR